MIDSRNIKDLHPCLQRAATELKRRLKESGYDMGVSSTYRDNEMQNLIYSYGRTIPNPNQNNKWVTATNAKGGESIHNYRLAFDIFNNVQSNLYPPAFINLSGKIGIEMGLEWGGTWSGYPDTPHFQFTGGLTLSQLQKGNSLASGARMKWETVKEDTDVLTIMNVSIDGGEIKTVQSVLKDGANYPNIRQLSEITGYSVGYDVNSKVVELNKQTDTAKMLFNGKEMEFERVLIGGNNYIRLRDLERCGFDIGFDKGLNMPVVNG